MHVDKKFAIILAKNPTYHVRNKHIDTMYHFYENLTAIRRWNFNTPNHKTAYKIYFH